MDDKQLNILPVVTGGNGTDGDIERAVIEANNGGRRFRRNVEKYCRMLGNTHTILSDFTQTKNKLKDKDGRFNVRRYFEV